VRPTFLLLAFAASATAAGVPRVQCFPFETLSPELRLLAERTLLEALDREALFTLIGGLKPMSSAILTEERQFFLDTAQPQLREYQSYQQIADTWRCGAELWAGVAPSRQVVPPGRDGKIWTDDLGRAQGHRTVYGNVVNLPAVRRTIAEHAQLFGHHGITGRTHPGEMLARLGMLDNIDFNLTLGCLYGYPSHAVEFYSRRLDRARNGEPLKPGDAVNVNIPTYKGMQENGGTEYSQFRYRVEPGHEDNAEDRLLRDTAAKILAAYRIRRDRYIGDGTGALALIRDWYDDGNGLCAPSNAKLTEDATSAR
jgi:hypothetical protein